MNKIKYLFTLSVCLSIATACTNFVDPAIPYNGFETGTYLKTLKIPAAHNFFDLDNSTFETKVECHAAGNINNVKEVDVFVRHRRGATLSPEVKLITIAGSEFAVAAEAKRPSATIKAKVTDVLAKIGFSKTNIKGGDFLEYRLVLNTLDGKTFSNTNLSADIQGGEYYNSPFFYRVAIVCPSDLGGTYDFTTTKMTLGDGGNVKACGDTQVGTVILKAAAVAGEYEISDASFGVFACAYGETPPLGSVRFTDSCGKIGIKGADRFTDVYSAVFVSATDTELTFTWKNTYGDAATTVLKKKTGTWPKGLN